jgi:retinol dehydrogenase 12
VTNSNLFRKHSISLNISRLILVCRDEVKSKEAKAQIDTAMPNHKTQLEVWACDLDSQESITAFTARVRTNLPRLHGFIANAGVEMTSYEAGLDGLERNLAVNVVGTLLQCVGILPVLQATAADEHGPNASGRAPTLCIVGSMGHVFAPETQLTSVPSSQDILNTLSSQTSQSDMAARYQLSKLILHLAAHELAEREAQRGDSDRHVTINIVNPGWCKTDLFRHKDDPLPVRWMLWAVGRTAEQGARALTHAVLAGAETHGCYLSECRVKGESWFVRCDEGREMQKRLWRELVGRLSGLDADVGRILEGLR